MAGRKDLAAALAGAAGISKASAEDFVQEFFRVVADGLAKDKAVKVKGLGTFKIIGVSARQSVDVNTGDPIMLRGREKITFTPDAVLKDLVNAPFAQFQPVAIGDDTDFSEIDSRYGTQPDVEETEEQPVPEENAATDERAEETVADLVLEETEVGESVSPDGDSVLPHGEIEKAENVVSGNVRILETSEEEESAHTDIEPPCTKEVQPTAAAAGVADTPDVAQPASNGVVNTPGGESGSGRRKVVFLEAALVLLLLAVAVGGYFAYGEWQRQNIRIAELVSQIAEMEQHSVKVEYKEETGGDTIVETHAPNKERKVAAAAAGKADTAAVEITKLPGLRLGAYNIVGIEKVVTVTPGRTLTSISTSHLGAGMEVYVRAVNGGITDVKPGMKVKIPKLKLKE